MAQTTDNQHAPLALKYRPRRFADLAGQEHIADTLRAALQQGNLKHAYIFSGTRGVGKTSAARIFARAINCLNRAAEGADAGEPCNECTACVGLLSGQSSDVFEIDAASYTKVDQTREILAGVVYRPLTLRYKVYIIDEAHMLSKASFNALLKTLEEPPEHVLFILATTEPDKILPTVRSRCQKFAFSALDNDTLETVLTNILTQEGIPWEAEAMAAITREAAGSARDGTSLMDQVVSASGALTLASVNASLGLLDRAQILALAEGLLCRDPGTVSAGCRAMQEAGIATKLMGRQLLEALHGLIREYAAGSAAESAFPLPEGVSLAELFRVTELVFQGYERALRSPLTDARFEIALIRIATLAPLGDLAHGPLPPLAARSKSSGNSGSSGPRDERARPPADNSSAKASLPPQGPPAVESAPRLRVVPAVTPPLVAPLPIQAAPQSIPPAILAVEDSQSVRAFKERALAAQPIRELIERFDGSVLDVRDLSGGK